MFIRYILKILIIKPLKQPMNNVKNMKIFNYKTIKEENADCCAAKTKVRWLITKETGTENFAMRLFEMEPTGYSPLHKHPWEHEIFILEGEGIAFNGEKTTPFKSGDVIFVPPNEQHQFKNNSIKRLKFLCLIPIQKK
jgi:quercetin dioxygenase-like cupin family protein